MTDKEFMKTDAEMKNTAAAGGSVSQEKQNAYVKEVNRRRTNTNPHTFKINYKTDKTKTEHYDWRQELDEKC